MKDDATCDVFIKQINFISYNPQLPESLTDWDKKVLPGSRTENEVIL